MDLRAIETFTSDSLLVLRAIMDVTSRAPDTHIGGNLPLDPTVASEFKASGFFEGFAKPPADLPQPRGLMKKKSDRMVYSRVAAELVDFASTRASVRRDCANASSQNLVEVMTNTHNHAGYPQDGKGSRKRQRERWWASVYCRDNVAYFSLLTLALAFSRVRPRRASFANCRNPACCRHLDAPACSRTRSQDASGQPQENRAESLDFPG